MAERSEERIGTLRGLRGRRLLGVEYLHPSSSDAETWYRGADNIDEVSMGITMIVDRGEAFDLVSTVEGLRWSLEVTRRTASKVPRQYLRIDASSSSNWAELVGQLIESVAVAEYAEEGHGTSLWSVRLTFLDGTSVVVSLGEVGEGRESITFIPDTVVVIFDAAIARGYCPENFRGPAWGQSV